MPITQPYPSPASSAPVWEGPAVPTGPAGGGLGLVDAYHDAIRYLVSQGASPELVSAQATGVDGQGQSGASGWSFVFALAPQQAPVAGAGSGGLAVMALSATSDVMMPTDPASGEPFASPSLAPSPLPTAEPSPLPTAEPPTILTGAEIAIQVEGDGDVMAPQKLARTGDPAIDFALVEPMSAILSMVSQAGGQMEFGSSTVALVTPPGAQDPVFDVTPEAVIPVDGPPLFESSPIVAQSPVPIDAMQPCGNETSGITGGVAAVAQTLPPLFESEGSLPGTYVLDAYTGALLSGNGMPGGGGQGK